MEREKISANEATDKGLISKIYKQLIQLNIKKQIIQSKNEWMFWIDISPKKTSVQFSHSVMSDFLRPHESQHARPPYPSPSPGIHSDSCPLSPWCYPAISSWVVPFSSCPQSLPASESFFQWVNSSHEVSKVLEFQLWHHSFQRNPWVDPLQNGQAGSPWRPRDSQESSPTPQFKRINSSVLSLLHSPTLTSTHDHRKNHSLD